MNSLKLSFRKNGLDYRLVQRNDKVAMFELFIDDECVGFEVSIVRIYPERIIIDHVVGAGEALPGNEQFGFDGSKAFFPDDLERANQYFISVTAQSREGKKPAIVPYDENGRLSETVAISNVGIRGLTATCIERRGKVAIYKRSDDYYEVFKIQILTESEFHGKHYPKREGYPGNEDFGVTAWCFKTENAARRQYRNLINKGTDALRFPALFPQSNTIVPL